MEKARNPEGAGEGFTYLVARDPECLDSIA